MKTKTKYCSICDKKTIWVEDAVSDLESATVWHCLECSTEERPDDYTDRGNPETIPPVRPRNSSGIEMKIPVGV